jgi:chromate transporter
MNTLWPLFVSFCVIGLGAYGGGLVAVPLIQHELVVSHQWLTQQDMTRIVAIAQITPGPIAINAATFVGYKAAGVVGALAAILAVVLPSIVILVVLSHFLENIGSSRRVERFRAGLRTGVLSLLIFAAWSYGQGVVAGPIELTIVVVAFLILLFFERRVHPLAVILGAGFVGAIIL